MKKKLTCLLASLLLCGFELKADYDLDDAATKEITTAENSQGQFNVTVFGDWIHKAKFDHDDAEGHIRFSHMEAQFDALVWYNSCYEEGLTLGLGYEYTKLNWNHNPYFKRQRYDTAVLNATVFTHRLCDWYWIASFGMNADVDKSNFSDYTTWDLTLWGRYQYTQNMNLHAGIYAETGMKLDLVLPIVGFDWSFCENWKLSAVFPVNMALVCTLDEIWTVSLAGRVFSDRHRAGQKGAEPKAVWRYSSAGAEVAVNANFCGCLTGNIHGGYDFGGRLKIANRHTEHSKRFRFNGAPYFGASLKINF